MFKKIISISLCLAILGSFTACKKNPGPEDSEYSIIYEYQYESDDSTDNENTDKNNSNGDSTQAGTNNTDNSNGSGSSNNNVGSGGNTGLNNNEVRDLKGRKITYVAWWDGTDRNSAAGKKIAEVEKLLNCKFEERKMTDYKPLYTSILAGDPIAELFCPRDQDAVVLANKGMVIALNTLPSLKLDEDCWDKSALKANTLNGNIYGMARNIQVRNVIMYNKTMFEKNGWEDLYTLQKNGKLTWDKLFSIAKSAIQISSSGEVTRYGFIPKYHISGLAPVFLGANGTPAVTRVGDTNKFKYNLSASNTAAVKALSTLQDLSAVKGFFYDNTNYGSESGRPMFYNGKGAMAMVDHDSFTTVAKNANFDIGMVLFPHGPDYNKNFVDYLCVPTAIAAGTKNPDDVALFWKTLRDKLNDSATYQSEGLFDTLPDESVRATITEYKKQYLAGNYSQDFYSEFAVTSEQYKKIVAGETTPAAAITAISQKITGQMEDYWK